ncbi:MAG TPA: hypothetical protein VI278_17935 [Nitrososphaeraceae archaeon]
MTNVYFAQLFVFGISPVSIVIRPCSNSHISFPHLMYSFLIVAFLGIDLAQLAQAGCLDLILFRNLVALGVASNFNEVRLFPKYCLINDFRNISATSIPMLRNKYEHQGFYNELVQLTAT